jgi:hypothetical protein
MTAGDMTSGKNHHHEGRADGERRNDAVTSIDDRTPDGEDQEKGTDKFHNILVHRSIPFSSLASHSEYRLEEGAKIAHNWGLSAVVNPRPTAYAWF